MRNYYGLRCSAKRVTQHKVTFRHENGSASGTYTSSPPAGGDVSLRLVSVAVPQAELRFSVSPEDRFIAAPLLRSPRGEAKFGAVFHGKNRGRQMKKCVIQLFYRRKKPLAVTLTDTVRQPSHTSSKYVSGCIGSKFSFAHITVTRSSVSERLTML